LVVVGPKYYMDIAILKENCVSDMGKLVYKFKAISASDL
jgi:hypothetical protein